MPHLKSKTPKHSKGLVGEAVKIASRLVRPLGFQGSQHLRGVGVTLRGVDAGLSRGISPALIAPRL
jgi:hypothetical protein